MDICRTGKRKETEETETIKIREKTKRKAKGCVRKV